MMTVREFAEQVLLSTDLETKLGWRADLVDEGRARPGLAPDAPGRPEALRMHDDRERPPLPKAHRLDDDEQRGLLLHFFANHELLATELMALVLLKFPDAPAEFRKGVLRTLREEQRHTTWYLSRMADCGVTFGDYPVSDFFWKSVAPMETPLDYVTRLSLTFEQANLDYSRHFAEVLRRSGDEKSARILERIYLDEIGHVGYGLKWFRRWKGKEEGTGGALWEAFERQLHFPLSPSRAKGNGTTFNVEGRLKAGLDETFVKRLELYRRSKGRTPNVYWFCPTAESEMAEGLNGGGFQPTKGVETLARDLEILPAFLAGRDDVVLMRQLPSLQHRETLLALGFDLPEFEALDSSGNLAAESLTRKRKLNSLRPWAWCPSAARLMAPLISRLPGNRQQVERFWNEAIRQLSSKAAALTFEYYLLKDGARAQDISEAGRVVKSRAAASDGVRHFREMGLKELVCKAPYSTAGQGFLRLSLDENVKDAVLNQRVTGWIDRVLSKQSAVIIEPWRERVFDFSLQYEMGEAGLRRLGIIRLHNDPRGQFKACSHGVKTCQGLEPEPARFLMEEAFPFYGPPFEEALQAKLQAVGYRGPLGIDAFVFRDAGGRLRHRAVSEINLRYTMGRITYELSRKVAAGHWVRFSLGNPKAFSAADLSLPVKPLLNGKGKLSHGDVILNDPTQAKTKLAVLTVAKRPEDLETASAVGG